jgi:hypothetical protein
MNGDDFFFIFIACVYWNGEFLLQGRMILRWCILVLLAALGSGRSV